MCAGVSDPSPLLRPRDMKLVHIYLNFAGNAEQAFTFYEQVFGTRILMKQTYGDTPFVKDAPEAAKEKIMHIQLPITESVHLMGNDAVEGISPPFKVCTKPYVNVPDVHISIVADDKAEADRVFHALSGDGGTVVMPIANAPWGPYFGMCVDRFGTQWMVSLPTPA
jgi:PhnB protein